MLYQQGLSNDVYLHFVLLYQVVSYFDFQSLRYFQQISSSNPRVDHKPGEPRHFVRRRIRYPLPLLEVAIIGGNISPQVWTTFLQVIAHIVRCHNPAPVGDDENYIAPKLRSVAERL